MGGSSTSNIVLAFVLLGCGSSASPPEPERPPSIPAPVEVTPSPEAAPAPACAAIGLLADPIIEAAARDANERGLALHASGDFEGSERLFSEAIAAAPNYRAARFNRVCALSRLGRLDDARAVLVPLLCEDLPTYAPKVETDPDLQALRGDALTQTVAAITEQYRARIGSGTPLTLFMHGPPRDGGGGTAWEESQAGIYLADERRFVPMGPRLRERGIEGASGSGGYALNATRFDPGRARVLAVLARGSDSEGGPALGPVEARVYEAPTGTLVMSHRFSVSGMVVTGRLDDEGAIVGFADFDDETLTYELTLRASGAHRSRAPLRLTDVLVASGVTWGYVRDEPIEARRAEHTLPDGRSVTLGRAPLDERREVISSSDPDLIWITTTQHGDCGVRDHYRVERMDVSTGERADVQAGVDGYAELEEGADGALYLQVHDTLWRFPDRGRGPGEQLWPGLGITSMANDFNPYC